MTKEEAAAEEVKTETKTDAPEAPAKTEAETKQGEEGQASGEGAADDSKTEEAKPSEGGKSTSTSTRKKKWLPWQRRDGNSVKGASQGADAAANSSTEDRQPTDAEIDAMLHKRIQELEQQKSRYSERLQQYRKINDLEKEVGEMRGEIDALKVSLQRAEDGGDAKVPDEGNGTTKPFAFQQ